MKAPPLFPVSNPVPLECRTLERHIPRPWFSPQTWPDEPGEVMEVGTLTYDRREWSEGGGFWVRRSPREK